MEIAIEIQTPSAFFCVTSAFVDLFRCFSVSPSSASIRFFSFLWVPPLWRQLENTGVETVMRFSRSRGGVIIALGSTRAPSSSKHSSSSSSSSSFPSSFEINFKMENYSPGNYKLFETSIFDVCVDVCVWYLDSMMRFN